MSVTIRRAYIEQGNADLESVAKLEAALNDEVLPIGSGLHELNQLTDWLILDKSLGKVRAVLLAEEEKFPKGHLIYLYLGEENAFFLRSLYVVKDARGNGIGSKLLDCMIKDAKYNSIRDIYTVPGKVAESFYKNLGFQPRKDESGNRLFLPVV